MTIDDRTLNRDYPLPAAGNQLIEDVGRLRAALTAIDVDMAARVTAAAMTAAINQAVADMIASAPGALDTLNELAAALGNDPNFAATITNLLALKAPLASPALTGTPTAPTAATGTNTTQLATTAFVQAADFIRPNAGAIDDNDISATAEITGSKIKTATTDARGTVQLTDSVASTSTTTAATPKSVKDAYDLAASRAVIVRATVQTATGSTVEFTGIPSWARKLTITGINISAANSFLPVIQLGTSSGYETTGYTSVLEMVNSTDGFRLVTSNKSSSVAVGFLVQLFNHSGNQWACEIAAAISGESYAGFGSKNLGSVLDRIRVSISGTTFDDGTINLLYEG